tara:strand:+ start:744 stop:1700 length:957 start_codon:yes stop_codon:yes gene_type:complete
MQDSLRSALEPLLVQQQLRAALVLPGDSYWYHRPQRDFPPATITDPAHYAGGDRLSLAITQTNLPAREQRALVTRWCELLPTLDEVRTLWFHTRVTQEIFEAACTMPRLQGLYVKWSAITSLAPLAGHRALSHLHLGGAPSATGLEALATLPALVDLELHNVNASADLAFVQGLQGLRALGLAGDSNSIKPLKIPSLAPLADLQEIERLSLHTVRVGDGSLAPLAEMRKLRWLSLANVFPMEEVARLAGRRPDIECDLFVASNGPVASIACKKCRRYTLHMTTGKGKPWLCETCDGDRLAKHLAAFETLRAAASSTAG